MIKIRTAREIEELIKIISQGKNPTELQLNYMRAKYYYYGVIDSFDNETDRLEFFRKYSNTIDRTYIKSLEKVIEKWNKEI
jgi:hypothetical protein